MAALLPIFLKLEGKPVLLVGAGKIAEEKIAKLILSNANITVVAPEVSEKIHALIELNPSILKLEKRKFRQSDVEGMFAVFSATNDKDVTSEVRKATQAHNILLNAADIPEQCDFYLGGTIHRGPLSISISSHGENPGLVSEFRKFLEEVIPEEHVEEVADFSKIRAQLNLHIRNRQERLQILRRFNQWFRENYLKPEPTDVNYGS